MKILVEEYQYDAALVRDVLQGLFRLAMWAISTTPS